MLIATPAIAPYHHQDTGYAIILKRQFIISTLYACVGFFKQSKPVIGVFITLIILPVLGSDGAKPRNKN